MTKVAYICTASNGEKVVKFTLGEARKFVEEHGGTFVMNTNYEPSDSEPYRREGARMHGHMK